MKWENGVRVVPGTFVTAVRARIRKRSQEAASRWRRRCSAVVIRIGCTDLIRHGSMIAFIDELLREALTGPAGR